MNRHLYRTVYLRTAAIEAERNITMVRGLGSDGFERTLPEIQMRLYNRKQQDDEAHE
jgi:hypothetical protein